MSRCFPFPPPRHEKNILCGEASVEWIEREKEKALKERRKAEKRAKKERKKQEKQNRKNGEIGKKKQIHEKTHKSERNKLDHKEVDNLKGREDEKSDLSEEHKQPANNQKACHSSDSTQCGSKRKNHSMSLSGGHDYWSAPCDGLSSVKDKDLEVPTSKVHSFSTLGRTKIIVRNNAEIAPAKEHPCSTSGRSDIPGLDITEHAPRSSFSGNDSLELECMQYSNLIENGIPPVQSECTDLDDMDWLFERKQHHVHKAKIFKGSNAASCHGSSSPWPMHVTCLSSIYMRYPIQFHIEDGCH